MGFYDLPKAERVKLIKKIDSKILNDFSTNSLLHTLNYFSDEDTYIRKAGYLAVGKIYKNKEVEISNIIALFDKLFISENEKIRQTTINAAGELGKSDFEVVAHFLIKACSMSITP